MTELAQAIQAPAPWRVLFDRRLGRPSVPIDRLLRLVKLVRRAGPKVVEELNAAQVAKLAQGKVLRAASCESTPRWWRPTSTTRPTWICWSMSASSVGWSGGSRAVGGKPDPVRDRGRASGRRGEAAGPLQRQVSPACPGVRGRTSP